MCRSHPHICGEFARDFRRVPYMRYNGERRRNMGWNQMCSRLWMEATMKNIPGALQSGKRRKRNGNWSTSGERVPSPSDWRTTVKIVSPECVTIFFSWQGSEWEVFQTKNSTNKSSFLYCKTSGPIAHRKVSKRTVNWWNSRMRIVTVYIRMIHEHFFMNIRIAQRSLGVISLTVSKNIVWRSLYVYTKFYSCIVNWKL